MIDLSIIIPMYNTDKEILKKSLSAVFNYEKINYEVIIVNDGSRIYSSQEYEDFINEIGFGNNIKYIYKENGGVSSSRNVGIKSARGKYITFVDSDDEFIFDNFISSDLKQDYDIIYYNFDIYSNNSHYTKEVVRKNIMLDIDVLHERFVISDDFNEPVAKIIKRNYLLENKIFFDEDLITGEDAIFNSKLLSFNPKINQHYKSIYKYNFDVNTSLNRWKKFPKKALNSTLSLFDKKEEFLNKYFSNEKYEELYNIYVDYIIDVLYSSTVALFQSNVAKKEFLMQISDYLKNKHIDVRKLNIKRKIKFNLLRHEHSRFFITIYKKKKKVFVQAYLNKNFGDDLFLSILSKRYIQKFYAFSFLHYRSYDNIKIYGGFYSTYINKLAKLLSKNHESYTNYLMKKADVNIMIGGSIFIQDDIQLNTGNFYTDIKAKQNAKNLYVLGANFGPYENKSFLEEHKKLFKHCKDVCFRDKYSYDLFKDIDTVRCAPDIVFSLDDSSIKKEKNLKNNVLISVINLENKPELHNFLAEYENKIMDLINYFDQKKYSIILMSFCKEEGDEIAINRIMSRIQSINVNKYFYDGNIEEALEVINSSKIVIGTRFHANIIGMTLGKTVIPIAYSDKMINTLKDINFEGKFYDIRDMKNFNVASLTDKDLNYKIDVSVQKKEAEKQFAGLDNILERRD